MGWGAYSVDNRTSRATSLGYDTKSTYEIFTQRQINNAMNPHGVTLRESRDNADHPNSLAIIIALDVTGSMGSVPHHLVKDGLPLIMGDIIQRATPDPQVLFVAIGDHECDSAPLQVGQFESSDELLDKWLTDVYIESGGGGNAGESYLLAWYFAAHHTAIDCLDKRNQRGFLFTIGDEPTLKKIPGRTLKNIMGDGQYGDEHANILLDRAREMYHVYHLHIKETGAGSRTETIDGWKQLMGDNLIVINKHGDVARTIADVIKANYTGKSVTSPPSQTKTSPATEEIL